MSRAKSTAVSYLILGVGYAVMIAVLVNALWVGSVARLCADLPDFLPGILPLALPMLATLLLAGFLYKFETHTAAIRTLTLVTALAMFIISLIGTIRTFIFWHRDLLPDSFSSQAPWLRLVGALIYGWLALQVALVARASNQRLERP